MEPTAYNGGAAPCEPAGGVAARVMPTGLQRGSVAVSTVRARMKNRSDSRLRYRRTCWLTSSRCRARRSARRQTARAKCSRAEPAEAQVRWERTGSSLRPSGLLAIDRTRPATGTNSASLDTKASCDAVAASYADMFDDGLDRQPYVRGALALFAELLRDVEGPVLDVGCGIGLLAGPLQDLGLEVFGIGLSPGMPAIALRHHPDLRFEIGSMTDLDVPDSSIGGLLAFSSVIHVPDEQIPMVFTHFLRVLRPGGLAMIGFHIGDEPHAFGGHRRSDPKSRWTSSRNVRGTLTSSGHPGGDRADTGSSVSEVLDVDRPGRCSLIVFLPLLQLDQRHRLPCRPTIASLSSSQLCRR